MFEYIKSLGALRILLLLLAVALTIIRPQPDSTTVLNGWEIFPTLIAPAMTPLVFMVLMFDFMMSRIRMSDEQVRSRFRFISYIELAFATVLFVAWLPFFLAIGR